MYDKIIENDCSIINLHFHSIDKVFLVKEASPHIFSVICHRTEGVGGVGWVGGVSWGACADIGVGLAELADVVVGEGGVGGGAWRGGAHKRPDLLVRQLCTNNNTQTETLC